MTKKETRIQLEGIAVPDWYLSLEPEIIEVMAMEAQVKARKEKLQTTLLTMMENEGTDIIKTDLTSASRRSAHEALVFDTTRFKEECPDDYKLFLKVASRSSSVTLKWLKQPNGEAK